MAAEQGGCVEKANFSQVQFRVLSEVTTVTSSRYSYLSSSSCTVLSQHLAHTFSFVHDCGGCIDGFQLGDSCVFAPTKKKEATESSSSSSVAILAQVPSWLKSF